MVIWMIMVAVSIRIVIFSKRIMASFSRITTSTVTTVIASKYDHTLPLTESTLRVGRDEEDLLHQPFPRG